MRSTENHEQFVSGGAGCEPHEALSVLALLSLSILNQTLLGSFLRITFSPGKVVRWVSDITLICTPALIVLADLMSFVNTIISCSLICVFLAIAMTLAASSRKQTLPVADNIPSGGYGDLRHHKYFIPLSYCRASILLTTLFCILAVDFPIFPRKLAKTDFHGFSLMDFGTGLFICVAAGVSSLKGDRRAHSEMKGAIHMTVLGILRALFVLFMDYQSPILEYGKHLNFFLCLAITRMTCVLFYHLIPEKYDLLFGTTIYSLYQLALQSKRMDDLLHSPDRTGFLAANKEGLASVIGSTCLFLITSAVCRLLVSGKKYSILIGGALLWNSLPPDIRAMKCCVKKFKIVLKNHFIGDTPF